MATTTTSSVGASHAARRQRDLSRREARVAERAASLRRSEIAVAERLRQLKAALKSKDGERRRLGKLIAIATANIKHKRGDAAIANELLALETIAAHFGCKVIRRARAK